MQRHPAGDPADPLDSVFSTIARCSVDHQLVCGSVWLRRPIDRSCAVLRCCPDLGYPASRLPEKSGLLRPLCSCSEAAALPHLLVVRTRLEDTGS
ncbi:hypothetical protein AGIG_G3848 [Arapaima gigas]